MGELISQIPNYQDVTGPNSGRAAAPKSVLTNAGARLAYTASANTGTITWTTTGWTE